MGLQIRSPQWLSKCLRHDETGSHSYLQVVSFTPLKMQFSVGSRAWGIRRKELCIPPIGLKLWPVSFTWIKKYLPVGLTCFRWYSRLLNSDCINDNRLLLWLHPWKHKGILQDMPWRAWVTLTYRQWTQLWNCSSKQEFLMRDQKSYPQVRSLPKDPFCSAFPWILLP